MFKKGNKSIAVFITTEEFFRYSAMYSSLSWGRVLVVSMISSPTSEEYT